MNTEQGTRAAWVQDQIIRVSIFLSRKIDDVKTKGVRMTIWNNVCTTQTTHSKRYLHTQTSLLSLHLPWRVSNAKHMRGGYKLAAIAARD